MSLFNKFILVNSSEFICLGISVLQTVILTRALGPAGIGQYAIIISVLALAPLICGLGIPLSLLYYSQHDPENRGKYIMHAFWVILCVGFAGGLATPFVIFFKPDYFGLLSLAALIAAGCYVPTLMAISITRSVLLIRIEAYKLGASRIISMVCGLLLFLALYASGVLTISWAIISFVFTNFIAVVLGWIWIRGYIDFSVGFRWRIIGKLVFMGIRQNWVKLAVSVYAQLSIFLIRYLINDFEEVGYFSRGQSIAALAVIAGQAVMPLLFSRWAAFPQKNLAAHVEKVLRFASTLCVVSILGILLSGKWLVLILYGRQFLPATQPMMILVPGAVLYLLSMILIELLNSRGHPEIAVMSLVTGVVINAGLCWYAVPMSGIVGAAWALTIGNIVLLLLLMSIATKKYGISIAKCILVSKSDIKNVMENFPGRNTLRVEK